MLYLYCDRNQIKLLNLKKSLLGQYEASFFEKTYQTDILENGRIGNVDFVASAIKESTTGAGKIADRDVFLILPSESFHFFQMEVPADIAVTALDAFVKDKARVELEVNLDDCLYDYFVTEKEGAKFINFYAIESAVLAKFKDALGLIDLKIGSLLPESLAYFKLFEKTLRREKKENIFYVTYAHNVLTGYLFDSNGLLSHDKWREMLTDVHPIEASLKAKAKALEASGKKLNRLILSGQQSDAVRQDTFTKAVGVWTNPLKRIITNFYQEYIKLVVSSSKQPFPILTYDACFGAFIFFSENKKFSFFKSGIKALSKKSFALPPLPKLPFKEIMIGLFSFGLSFAFFFLIFKMNFKAPTISNNLLTRPTPPPTKSQTPPVTPTPAIKKEDIKIKILNGSGTRGQAAEIKDLLQKAGYGEVLTGNADNFDYANSELKVKKSKPEIAALLKNDLKDHVTSLKVTTLEEKEAADIVLIFGADFK